jgi:microcystin degradation protein MlrC
MLCMRIAIGGISHETNTFNTVPTDLEQFQINTGKEILQSLKDTNTVILTLSLLFLPTHHL